MLTPLEHRHNNLPLVVGLLLAVLVHLGLVIFVIPWFMPDLDQVQDDVEKMLADKKKDKPKENKDFPDEVRVVLRTVEYQTPEPQKKPEEQEKPEEEKKEEPPEVIELKKTVEQVTNEEEPVDANYVSEQANKTKEETRATETTMKDVLPSNESTPEQENAGSPDPDVERSDRDEDPQETQSEELAMAIAPSKPELSEDPPQNEQPLEESNTKPEEKEEEVERPPSPDGLFKPSASKSTSKDNKLNPSKTQKVDPKKLFSGPSIKDYERVLGEESDSPKSMDKKGKKRRRLFANYAEKQKLIKGSLENMITEIKPGNHTSVNAKRSVYVGYINALHRRIHERWANDFLISLDVTYPRSSPLQDPNLNTTLEFVIDAKSGEFEAVNVVKSSGEIMFDSEAINTAWSIGRRPNPPPQIVSPNGKIYVHWNFWRDGRQCGVMHASIYLMKEDADGNTRKERTKMVK